MKVKEVFDENFKLNELAPTPTAPNQQTLPTQQKPPAQKSPAPVKMLTPQELLAQLNAMTNSNLQIDAVTIESLKKIVPAFLTFISKVKPVQSTTPGVPPQK
jgi:hypothetical protein